MMIAAAILLLAAAPVPAEVRSGSFASASLGRDVTYSVQLPPSYASGTRRYPALYVLHGLFEGPAFWERRGLAGILEGLWEKGDVPEMIVVAVDVDNSFFVNGPAGRWADMLGGDLVAHGESTYRVAPGRGGRALLGITIAGYA